MTGGGKQDFLRARPRIGSCKVPVSYSAQQVVFHHDDIPEVRRQRVKEVKDWASSKLLSIDRRPWTKSTLPDGAPPVCERRQAENAERNRANPYAYNFRAETLDYAKLVQPIDRPSKFRMSLQTESEVMEIARIMEQDPVQRGILKRTEEMPVHPDLLSKTPWNNGVVLSVSAQQASLDRMNVKSRQSTKRVNDMLVFSSKGYVRPVDQVILINQRLREEKKQGHKASSVKISHIPQADDGVKGGDEEIDRKSLRNRQAIEPSRKYSSYRHSGTWEFNPIEGRFMWSDTGSFIYESRGDVKVTRDPDRYNLESVDMPRVRIRTAPLVHPAPWGSVVDA